MPMSNPMANLALALTVSRRRKRATRWITTRPSATNGTTRVESGMNMRGHDDDHRSWKRETDMKKIFWLLVMVATAAPASWGASNCKTDTLANYLGAPACRIAMVIVGNFTYNNNGTEPLDPSQITVIPLRHGIRFRAPWKVSGVNSTESVIGFSVSGTLNGLSVEMKGFQASGTGCVAMHAWGEGVARLDFWMDSLDASKESAVFGPRHSMTVNADIGLLAGGNGAASLVEVDEQFGVPSHIQ
jgi:hypothetical protein